MEQSRTNRLWRHGTLNCNNNINMNQAFRDGPMTFTKDRNMHYKTLSVSKAIYIFY